VGFPLSFFMPTKLEAGHP